MGERDDRWPAARVVAAVTHPDRASCDAERLDGVTEGGGGGFDRRKHRIVVVRHDGAKHAESFGA